MPLRETSQVLIIDTDLESSRVIHAALANDGHQAHLANEAPLALEFARQTQPEIIVLDSHAHFGRGLELVPALFEASPSSPIVITTIDPTIGAEITARDHGAFDVLVKPFRDLTLLSQRLNVAIQTSRALREREGVIAELSQNAGTVEQLQAHVLDLSERLTQMTDVKHLGLDEYTGLLTEAEFMDRLANESSRALRYARPVSVGVARIDGYEAIGERYGNETAGLALKSVASVVRSSLRDIDLAGRFASDEIGYILPETDKKAGEAAAERLRVQVEDVMLTTADDDIHLSLTIGFAALPCDTMNANGLLACARGACRAAASVGVNHVLGFRA